MLEARTSSKYFSLFREMVGNKILITAPLVDECMCWFHWKQYLFTLSSLDKSMFGNNIQSLYFGKVQVITFCCTVKKGENYKNDNSNRNRK